MFVHTCTSCTQRMLVFPSQITGLSNTDRGIVVTFTCWCDAPQTMLTGRLAAHAGDRREPTATAA